MSGGHFNYTCFNISEFADELKREILINDDTSEDEYGDRIGYGYSPETILRLSVMQQIIELAGKLAREIEWLYSDDHGEDSFNRLADGIVAEYKSSLLTLLK